MKRGNGQAAMAAAEVTVEGTFTTSAQTHNPLGPFTTMAPGPATRLRAISDRTRQLLALTCRTVGNGSSASSRPTLISPKTTSAQTTALCCEGADCWHEYAHDRAD